MSRAVLFVLLTFVIGSACSTTLPEPNTAPKRPPRSEASGRGDDQPGREEPSSTFAAWIGGVPVRLEPAATPDSRRIGLAGRRSLQPDEGMLFAYPDSDIRSYWMKGCLIGLDIAFVDEERRVFQIETLDPNPSANDATGYPTATSVGPARWVIEMPKGWFRRHGLDVGVRLKLSPGLERIVNSVDA